MILRYFLITLIHAGANSHTFLHNIDNNFISISEQFFSKNSILEMQKY